MKKKLSKKNKILSKKDKIFVKEIIKTGNQTQAAKKAYGIKKDDYAGKKGSIQVRKGKIKETIERYGDRFPDEMLAEKHMELLNQKQVAYFVFPKFMDDEEITEKVNSAGFEVIVIRFGEKGKYAFYSNSDSNAKKAAIDMAYKIKGSYAPEKKTIELDEELLAAVKNRVGNILG